MKIIIATVVLFVAIIIGITIYLSPDDLSDCGEKPSASEQCKVADAVVAVSGGDTSARAQEAISLYQAGWAQKIIFSGAALDKSGPSNAEVMRQEAAAAGVSSSDIIIEESSETTKENAEKTQNILDENNIESVILVTSAYHQRRAGLEFKKRYDDVVSVRSHPVSSDKQWSLLWWATPIGWFLAISELSKILVFYVGSTR